MAGRWLNADGIAVVGYALAALSCLYWGLRERSLRTRQPMLWPGFWFAVACLLAAMAVARGIDLGELLASVGRRLARSEGWYASRREIQVVLVGAVVAAAAVAAVIGWLGTDVHRRHRYLPVAFAFVTLVVFDAAGSVSLHQIDTLLYSRQVNGVRAVAPLELTLLMLTVVAVWITGTRPLPGRAAQPPR